MNRWPRLDCPTWFGSSSSRPRQGLSVYQELPLNPQDVLRLIELLRNPIENKRGVPERELENVTGVCRDLPRRLFCLPPERKCFRDLWPLTRPWVLGLCEAGGHLAHPCLKSFSQSFHNGCTTFWRFSLVEKMILFYFWMAVDWVWHMVAPNGASPFVPTASQQLLSASFKQRQNFCPLTLPIFFPLKLMSCFRSSLASFPEESVRQLQWVW